MTNAPTNGPPSVGDIARRLQRVEDKLDERIASVDMLRSLERSFEDHIQSIEKLFEAKLLSQKISTDDVGRRTTKIEASLSKVNFALLGAFLTLLVLIIITVLTASGKGT